MTRKCQIDKLQNAKEWESGGERGSIEIVLWNFPALSIFGGKWRFIYRRAIIEADYRSWTGTIEQKEDCFLRRYLRTQSEAAGGGEVVKSSQAYSNRVISVKA